MPFKELKVFAKIAVNEQKILSSQKNENVKLNSLVAELIRNTHSIEKGLSINNPRLGFGHKKQKEMLDAIEVLYKKQGTYKEACKMALGALQEYLKYHKDKGYTDDFCIELERFLKDYPEDGSIKNGGTIEINKEQLQFDTTQIEHFFKTRHSIRDFDSRPVDNDVLARALSLAQTAPSACNRQGVRAYVLSPERSKKLSEQLAGIGGFADSVSRFILVTGKTSAYRIDEINQYIVSASIYAAYLSLTLHLYGLGACIVQRPVIWSKEWEKIRKWALIEEDEQMICLLAVGDLKEQFVAPMSHRISSQEIIKFID